MKKSGGLNILVTKVNTYGEKDSKDIKMPVSRVLNVCVRMRLSLVGVCVCAHVCANVCV